VADSSLQLRRWSSSPVRSVPMGDPHRREDPPGIDAALARQNRGVDIGPSDPVHAPSGGPQLRSVRLLGRCVVRAGVWWTKIDANDEIRGRRKMIMHKSDTHAQMCCASLHWYNPKLSRLELELPAWKLNATLRHTQSDDINVFTFLIWTASM